MKIKTWSRVIFNINPLTGRINKHFDTLLLKRKITQLEVESILTKFENETNFFSFIRYYTKLKILLIFSIALFLILFILSLSVIKSINLIILSASSEVFFSLIFLWTSTLYFKKRSTKHLKIIQDISISANELILLKKRLYILPNQDFKHIAIYIIPLCVNLGVILHNFSIGLIVGTTKNDLDNPSREEIIKVNKRNSIFSTKYTNFRNNYITGVV